MCLGFSARFANTQHMRVDIADRDMRALTGTVKAAKRHIARPARHINMGKGPVVARRVYLIDHCLLPGAMQPARQKIIHQVIAARHPLEDVMDELLLFAFRDLAEAEIDGRVWGGGCFGFAHVGGP